MTSEDHIMENLSRAYVRAVAAYAACNLTMSREQDYGVDGTFYHIQNFNNKRSETGFNLDFQLKSTFDWECRDEKIIYELKAHNYNTLVRRYINRTPTPAILILLCLPRERTQWLEHNEEQLLLRKCCYWEKFTGSLTNNAHTITIRINRQQQLTHQTLSQFFSLLQTGEWYEQNRVQ